MPQLIKLPTFEDPRGKLTVLEKCLPFDVKRAFFIYDINDDRAGHGHKHSTIALIAFSGKVTIEVQNPKENLSFTLENPSQCLILQSEDWHLIKRPKDPVVLLALSSHFYDKNDYFYEKYR